MCYDNYNHGTGKVNKLIEQLVGRYNQLGGAQNAFDITPYISIFTWHYYPFNDQSDVNEVNIPKPTRPNVINYLATGAPAPAGFTTRPLKTDIQEIKGWLTGKTNLLGQNIGVAITEANICHINDVLEENGADDKITGVGSNSFIAGQFWSEMMAICMKENCGLNFWSSVEGCHNQTGCTQPNYRTNIGFLNRDPGNFGGVIGFRKPTYWHFKMMAENFKGTFYPGTVVSKQDLKAFGSKSASDVVVMLLNQYTSGHSYNIDLNGSSGNINFSTGIAGTYTCEIAAKSTSLLRFDHTGTLLQHLSYGEGNTNGPVDFFNSFTYSTTYNNYTVTGTETWNTISTFKGTLTIPSGATLNLQANLEAAPGAFIVVEPGGVLNITKNAVIKPVDYCYGPWEGVEIKVTGSGNGTAYLMENSSPNGTAVLFKP